MHIRSRIERVIDIRPGEGARTALMFFTMLLLIASYTTTKAVRDAVFLSKFGLTELSYMYIGIAVVAGVVVTAYKRATVGLRAQHRGARDQQLRRADARRAGARPARTACSGSRPGGSTSGRACSGWCWSPSSGCSPTICSTRARPSGCFRSSAPAPSSAASSAARSPGWLAKPLGAATCSTSSRPSSWCRPFCRTWLGGGARGAARGAGGATAEACRGLRHPAQEPLRAADRRHAFVYDSVIYNSTVAVQGHRQDPLRRAPGRHGRLLRPVRRGAQPGDLRAAAARHAAPVASLGRRLRPARAADGLSGSARWC